MTESQYDHLKKEFYNEQQVRVETEKTLEDIQKEALSHNGRYVEEMGKIKQKIEQLKHTEKEQITRIQQLEIEKNQFLNVINGMQTEHKNQYARVSNDIDSKNEEIKRLLDEITN